MKFMYLKKKFMKSVFSWHNDICGPIKLGCVLMRLMGFNLGGINEDSRAVGYCKALQAR